MKKDKKGRCKRVYICPKADMCDNRSCFMRIPRNRTDYATILGHIGNSVRFSQCIERFNEIFECGGMKLELQEVIYRNRIKEENLRQN